MARYTGPKVRVTRRLGVNIFENEKGRKALERRPFPPGAHGRTRRRNAGSEYLAQLQEKQKAKYIYGLLERQFRKTYDEATRLSGPSGENLLRLLELRDSTTSSTAPDGQAPGRRPASSSTTGSSTSTASGSTSRATAGTRATSCRCRPRPGA